MNLRSLGLLCALLALAPAALAADVCDPAAICAGHNDAACNADRGRCVARTQGIEGCRRTFAGCGAFASDCWAIAGQCFGSVGGAASSASSWEARCTNLDTLCGPSRGLGCVEVRAACLARSESDAVCEAFNKSKHCGKIGAWSDPTCAAVTSLCKSMPDAIVKARNHREPQRKGAATTAPSESPIDEVLGRTFKLGDASFTGAFPKDFLFGAATSAHQVEGDNTGNDWFAYERMCRDPKLRKSVGVSVLGFKVQDLCQRWELSGKAVRHHERAFLDADLDRAKALGMGAYRFSIEWSRVEPADGKFDERELDKYRRDVEAMRSRGLEPIVTLHHYTLPLWLSDPTDPTEKLSGFMNGDAVAKFRRFTSVVVRKLGDKVRYWTTLNEPAFEFSAGYVAGVFPPGRVGPGRTPKDALKNLVLAHAAAYDEIKRVYRDKHWAQPLIGFAHGMFYVKVAPSTEVAGIPITDHTKAAKQLHFIMNDMFIEATQKGCYRLRADEACDESLRASLAGRLDFVGINYYRSVYVYHSPAVTLTAPYMGGMFDNDLSASATVPHTHVRHNLLNDLGWELMPDGLYRLLLHTRTLTTTSSAPQGLPILITENGYPQNLVKDTEKADMRAPYLLAHLQAVLRAMRDGVNVFGYLHWSLVDNWELGEGYTPNARFGLVAVDRRDCQAVDLRATKTGFETITRGACTLPKRNTRGAAAYSEVMRSRAITRDVLGRYGVLSPDGSQRVSIGPH